MPRGHYIDLVGQKFGRLIVVERAPSPYTHGGTCWRCLCVCGRYRIVLGSSLRQGLTSSCGCFRRERVAEAMKRRGKHAQAMKAFGRRRTVFEESMRESVGPVSPHADKPVPKWDGCESAIADLAACLGMR
jgi:hypothetical protein